MNKDMRSEQETDLTAVSERRQWKRLTVAIPMFVRGTDLEGKPFVDFATALNIGDGGALLALKRGLAKGGEVSLEIPVGFLPQAQVPNVVRQIQGRLLRVERAENGFLVGIQFSNLLPS